MKEGVIPISVPISILNSAQIRDSYPFAKAQGLTLDWRYWINLMIAKCSKSAQKGTRNLLILIPRYRGIRRYITKRQFIRNPTDSSQVCSE